MKPRKRLETKKPLARKTPLVRKTRLSPSKAATKAKAKKKIAVVPEAPPTPAQIIAGLAERYRTSSDPQLVAALGALPALRDEDDPVWDDEVYWSGVAYPFLALADVAAERRLWPAVRLLLDRACFGDPGEIMRGLRHSLEAIANPDWAELAEICIAAIATGRPGTVLWAADELAILDDPRAFPVFEKLRHSEHERIREVAERGLERLMPDAN